MQILSRRMTLWQEGHIDIFIDEFEHCAKGFSKILPGRMDEAHVIKLFTRLIWRGQLRSTFQWVTERVTSVGILDPSHVVQDDKTVLIC